MTLFDRELPAAATIFGRIKYKYRAQILDNVSATTRYIDIKIVNCRLRNKGIRLKWEKLYFFYFASYF